MDILKINTSPSFQIVSRKKLDVSRVFKFLITNEMTKKTQDILSGLVLLPNENYTIILASFPLGKAGDKLAYKLVDNITNEIVLMGKILIIPEIETTQDYSKKTNNKFYK